MDDIYFLVLRIWGALTSHKRALVALTVVAAVVVTVTTVLAAPLDEPRAEDSDVFVSMEPPKMAAPVVMSMVSLNPTETLSIGGVDSPGLLPTSPFYFAKSIVRDVQYAFKFDSIDKANLKLRYANEDALAIRAMCLEGQHLAAAQQCFSYQDNFFNSLAWAVKARKQGSDVDVLMENLMMAHHGHRLILADALAMVDESQLEAVVGAITYTSAPFEQVIQWTKGSEEAAGFHDKLRNDFSSVGGDAWLMIENRLGLEVQQAITLSKAMGDSSSVGAAPVITSVTAEKMIGVAPNAQTVITCKASDLSGGALSYQWMATRGSFDDGNGPVATWTAPDEPGLYTVTVVVSDERGNQSRKTVNLRVGNPEVPVSPGAGGAFWIEEIRAERDPSGRSAISPPVLGQTWKTSERSVFIKSPIRITCEMGGVAEGLTYEWSCDVGEVLGSGESVVWVAPGHACKAQVFVIVRNGSGGEERATVSFRVSTCSSCFSW